MKRIATSLVTLFALVGSATAAELNEPWSAYLDYAYVFSSAGPKELTGRLDEYGREAGMSLADYVRQLEARRDPGEIESRRRAVGNLLLYLASGDPDALERSVKTIRELEGRLTRRENRYWYHYVLAHRALERGHAHDFVAEVLSVWLRVVIPMEGPHEALRALSLSDAANSGFVAALPYVYENLTRIILIRSQELGMNRNLDPLGSLVRLLREDRVGAHPDVIPAAASSRDYLERIAQRLDGPESDAGSLTFTLALFEASKLHDRARSLLAQEGFSQATREAIRVASGAYAVALDRSNTVQGQAAVYTRVLRLRGEIYASKQRLADDADIETPFSIEGAIEVWGALDRLGEEGWAAFESGGADAYGVALRGLWEEIQEASLNAATYYLARSLSEPRLANDHSRSAARIVSRLLSFFEQHASQGDRAGVPDSAYFAAYEAARTFGEAFLVYAAEPTPGQIDLATRSFRRALALFPFDWRLWPSLTQALERHGQEGEFLSLAGPVAERLARSRAVDTWINLGEQGAKELAALRSALADSQVLMVLGFSGVREISELESDLDALRQKRSVAVARLAELNHAGDSPPAAPALDSGPSIDQARAIAATHRKLAETKALLQRLDRQIAATSRALPLYESTGEMDALIAALRARRDHPVHTLLRRMYHETRS